MSGTNGPLKVYERGVELFAYPVSFEIWNIYLAKFVKRYVSISIYTLFRNVDVGAGW